jgi:hypothetical protein
VSLPFVGLLLVVVQLENRGSSVHGSFDVKDGELYAFCFLLCFFHGKDEVRHACSIFVEEEHVQAQCEDVEGMKTSGVLLEVFEEVTHKDLVEECGAILVISRLVMYRTNVLMYRTMVLLARPTKVRC